MSSRGGLSNKIRGYAPVSGLSLYYEIEGHGAPLVFIPPAFGHAGSKSFPTLARNRSVITVDLQGNGRTKDMVERPISIEQYARDVVGLLEHLEIDRADFLGESYGATTATMIAVRHPSVVRRVATYSGTFAAPLQNALDPRTTHYEEPPTAESRCIRYQRECYEAVAPDPSYWPRIFDKVAAISWNGFSKQELASIRAPLLVIVGDHDFVRVQHALEAVELIPHAELAVIPDASHFALSSEPERVLPIVQHFFEKPETRLPLATAQVGYQPGETR